MNAFKFASFVMLAALTASLTGCATPQGATRAEKIADVQQMRSESLSLVYSKMPSMRDTLARAAGYGVFSGISTHTIIMSSSNAFGVIRDNTTKKDTYMRALKLGAGLGAGAQTVRVIVVFHDAKTMNDILDHGWSLTGRAEAAAKVGDVGDSGAVVIALPGMSIYRFTQTGAMAGGAIEGAKVWKDDELN
ncbi:MAG: hypothetical protein GC162_20285 [Planctomycetes bacterium]|nr:hypothetical protein [Planctomycetota bacterium]